MLERLKLSSKSQTLLNTLQETDDSFEESDDTLLRLIAYLNNECLLVSCDKPKEDIEFLKAQLVASLLTDLRIGLSDEESPSNEQDLSWVKLGQVIFLGLAGTLVAACQGFDSVVGMLTMLPIPAWAILTLGIAFSILSVVVFYSLDLIQVSNILGVRLWDTPKLLDTYLSQLHEIKKIRQLILSNYCPLSLSKDELQQLKEILSMLQYRINALIKDGKQFDEALHSLPVKAAQYFFSGMAGLLFFGGGFFAGQSVAMFLLGLFMASVTPTFLPVIIFGVVVGVAAFCIYWYLEFSESNKLISGWFGLDKDTIEQLCDVSHLTEQNKKLEQLKRIVIGDIQLKSNNPLIPEEPLKTRTCFFQPNKGTEPHLESDDDSQTLKPFILQVGTA